MKKAVLIAALSLLSLALFAQSDILIQGSYLNASRTFSDGSSENNYTVPSVGLNIVSFKRYIGEVGVFSSGTFLLPLEFKVNGTDGIETFDSFKITLDALLGPGVNIDLGYPELLIGGGLHFSGYAFISGNSTVHPDLSYTLGAGLSATAKFPITDNFNFNIGAMAGYDFIEIVHIPSWSSDVSLKSGFTALGVNAGIGIKY